MKKKSSTNSNGTLVSLHLKLKIHFGSISAEPSIRFQLSNEKALKYASEEKYRSTHFLVNESKLTKVCISFSGGDLMSLLIKMGIFSESLARFYIAELTCAVESVHKMGFIHRYDFTKNLKNNFVN